MFVEGLAYFLFQYQIQFGNGCPGCGALLGSPSIMTLLHAHLPSTLLHKSLSQFFSFIPFSDEHFHIKASLPFPPYYSYSHSPPLPFLPSPSLPLLPFPSHPLSFSPPLPFLSSPSLPIPSPSPLPSPLYYTCSPFTVPFSTNPFTSPPYCTSSCWLPSGREDLYLWWAFLTPMITMSLVSIWYMHSASSCVLTEWSLSVCTLSLVYWCEDSVDMLVCMMYSSVSTYRCSVNTYVFNYVLVYTKVPVELCVQ